MQCMNLVFFQSNFVLEMLIEDVERVRIARNRSVGAQIFNVFATSASMIHCMASWHFAVAEDTSRRQLAFQDWNRWMLGQASHSSPSIRSLWTFRLRRKIVCLRWKTKRVEEHTHKSYPKHNFRCFLRVRRVASELGCDVLCSASWNPCKCFCTR